MYIQDMVLIDTINDIDDIIDDIDDICTLLNVINVPSMQSPNKQHILLRKLETKGNAFTIQARCRAVPVHQ